MQLLELQRQMLAELQQPMAPEQSDDAAAYIQPSRRLSARERLGIYHRSYWARLRESLGEDFPALRAVVGRRQFAALIDAYLAAHPSRSWTLRDLGQFLPHWLAQHPEEAGRRWRAAVDAARLEWAYIEAYDVAALEPLGAEAVASITAESRLSLQPHLRLLDLHSSVDELVLATHRHPHPAPLPRLRKEPVWLAVHRTDNLVYYRRLDAVAFALLQALGNGHTLAQAVTVGCAAAEHESKTRRAVEPTSPIEQIHDALALATQLGWLCAAHAPAPQN